MTNLNTQIQDLIIESMVKNSQEIPIYGKYGKFSLLAGKSNGLIQVDLNEGDQNVYAVRFKNVDDAAEKVERFLLLSVGV